MPLTKVILFGTQKFASLVHYYLTRDSNFRVIAFAEDRSHMRLHEHEGLPVLTFEDLPLRHPPGTTSLCVSLGYRAVNGFWIAARALSLRKGVGI